MPTDKKGIFVFAHWMGMPEPVLIGVLSAHQGKGRKSFSFEYDNKWLKNKRLDLLDPDIRITTKVGEKHLIRPIDYEAWDAKLKELKEK